MKIWLGTVLVCATLLSGAGYYIKMLHDRLDNAATLAARNEIALASCNARVAIFMRMQERNRAINNLTDDDLRDVPGRWLLPPASTTGR